MKKRLTLKGKILIESDFPITLKVITKIPEKWILFDSETGQKYIGTNNIEIGKNWKLIEDE